MSYKPRPKNKQELSAKSGKKIRKQLPRKTIVDFSFVADGASYGLGSGRIKISHEGGISCLIRDEEGKWKAVKGNLVSIKLKTVIIKNEQKKTRR